MMTDDKPLDTHCARCLRPAPHDIDDPEFDDWEALTVDEDEPGSLVICPDCITPEERQAMDEAGWEE
jgi:hypothetical protein